MTAEQAPTPAPATRWHRFRPLKGWRAFGGEVGVIVLGVLLALVAQQAVETLSVHNEVGVARLALRRDYIGLVASAHERVAEDGCLRRRLEQVATLLDASTTRLPATGDIGSPPARDWYPSSWDGIAVSRVSSELSRDDLVAFGSVARSAQRLETLVDAALDDWAQLYRIVGPGRTAAPGEIADMHAALARAASRLNSIRLIAPQVEQIAMERRLLTPADLTQVDALTREYVAGNNYRAICGPIGPVLSRRVTAPYDPDIQGDPLTGKPMAAAR